MGGAERGGGLSLGMPTQVLPLPPPSTVIITISFGPPSPSPINGSDQGRKGREKRSA